MKISLEWLGDYVELPADLDPKTLKHDLTMATVEVEQATDLGRSFDNVVVALVLSVTGHPNADRLRLAELDDGRGRRTVVCGASNVAPGMKVALALPGAAVRDRHGTELVIEATAVRGAGSAGMICSAQELGVGDLLPCGETEICDLGGLDAPPGTPLAKAIGYDDVVFEIDNKSLTNRPDLWGHYGVARELSAIYDVPLKPLPAFAAPRTSTAFEVRIEDPERCRRFTATHITGVRPDPAPFWMRSRLARVGQRPIDLLVDLTNYVMLAVGQPSHAFDARDLPERVEVRRARDGEPLTLLDGTNLKLEPETLVVAGHDAALALAGVMGGDLGVRADTSELWLEVANFEPVGIRRATRRYGQRTESSTRFEKGLDPEQVTLALGLFLALLREQQPSARVTAHVDSYPSPLPAIRIDAGIDFLQRRLGRALPPDEISSLLRRLGFETAERDGVLLVGVPSWRATGDVSLPEDIVEEVARLYGYEELGFSPPVVTLHAPVIQPRVRMERRVREFLAGCAGMRECVSYPWVEESLLDAAGMLDTPTLGLANPPSPGVRLAPSLVPQLLGSVASNLRYSKSFRIFEVARVFRTERRPTPGSDETLPEQPLRAAGAFVGPHADELFLQAKGVIEGLARGVHTEPLGFARDVSPRWGDPGARLAITAGGRPIGELAVVSSRTKRTANIRLAEVAMFEIEVDALTPHASRENEVVPLPAYPESDFDISVIVEQARPWSDVEELARRADPRIRSVSFVEQYVGQQVPDGHKSLTLRLRLGSEDGTLTREQIDEAAGKVIRGLRERFGGQVRSE